MDNSIWSLIVFAGTVAVLAAPLSAMRETTACYGTAEDCAYYTLDCNDSEIIRIEDLYVGRKDQEVCIDINTRCYNPDLCCVYNASDVLESFNKEHAYNTYRNCSGTQSCGKLHVPWQVMQGGNTSTYVRLGYTCMQRSYVYPICSEMSATLTVADIMFSDATNNTDYRNATCKCYVQNDLETNLNVTIRAVDVRLAVYSASQNETAGNCSSAVLTVGSKRLQCRDSNDHHIDNFIYSSDDFLGSLSIQPNSSTIIELKELFSGNTPEMLWLKVAADRNFTLVCGQEMDVTSMPITSSAEVTTATSSISSTSESPTTTMVNVTDTSDASFTSTSSTPSTTDFSTTNAGATISSTTDTGTTSELPSTTATSIDITSTVDSPTTTFMGFNESTTLNTSNSSSTYFDTNGPVTVTSSTIRPPGGSSDQLQNDDDVNEAIYVSIFVPLAVLLLVLLLFGFWCHRQRRARTYKVGRRATPSYDNNAYGHFAN